MNYFKNRKLAIATQHNKDKVISPLMAQHLGVQCFVPELLDTDSLGTFSGEVERVDNPLITVRKKCDLARESTGCDLVVANEGSFGPHPSLYFVPCDEEIFMWVDYLNDLEVSVKVLSTETNFKSAIIKNADELRDFLYVVQFPSHALILKEMEVQCEQLYKGIDNYDSLYTHFNFLLEKYGQCFIETDMRAMCNPTRMKVIEEGCKKLIDKLLNKCPLCKIPGFGISEYIEGLPCGCCGLPTKSLLAHIYRCQKCFYTYEKLYPYDKNVEDPMHCDFCNP